MAFGSWAMWCYGHEGKAYQLQAGMAHEGSFYSTFRRRLSILGFVEYEVWDWDAIWWVIS